MNGHARDDHHVCIEQSMFGVTSSDACVCGAAANDPLHHAPPCEWCRDDSDNPAVVLDLGAPRPWWHRAWCRFIVWLFRPEIEAEMRRHPAGKKKESN